MKTNTESDNVEWCGVGSKGERGWRPEQVRPVGEKERAVAIGRGGGVNNRAKEGKEGAFFFIFLSRTFALIM